MNVHGEPTKVLCTPGGNLKLHGLDNKNVNGFNSNFILYVWRSDDKVLQFHMKPFFFFFLSYI